MKINNLEHCSTPAGDFNNAVFVFFPSLAIWVLVAAYYPDLSGLVIGLVAAVVVVSALIIVIRQKLVKNFLKDRAGQLSSIANQPGFKYYADLSTFEAAVKDTDILKLTLAQITNQDVLFDNFVTTDQWTYFDFKYGHYRKTRNGDYKSADIYYSVVKTQLSRQLPNIFFDSKTARRRQFRFFFKRRQRYHFEGDFDKYFDTYLPEGYAIDSLSFITPDVLQNLKTASKYDCEIIGDNLFLYGKLSAVAADIEDMSGKLLQIKKSLAITTQNYIDKNVPYNLGSSEVTPQAAFLARSKFWIYVHIAAFTAYIIARFALAIKH